MKTEGADITIQEHVPICPDCGEGLRLCRELKTYVCRNCKGRYEIIDKGYTDREIICRKIYPEMENRMNLSMEG